MSGKLIALEAHNGVLLSRAAEALASQLRNEGYKVEIKSFPQRAHSSAYFVNRYEQGAYEQANPYVTSLFYALDRFESKTEIEELLKSDVTVICAGYLGTTLATLGAEFTDKQVRKGYYMWAYSLETGTFGIAKPDVSVVISEDVASFGELTEFFPSDFILQTNQEHLRETITTILPSQETQAISTKELPVDNEPKKTGTKPSTISLLRVVNELAYDSVPELAIRTSQHVEPKNIQPVHINEYRKSLTMLADKRKTILSRVHKKDRLALEFLLLPLATKADIPKIHHKPKSKNTALQGLIDEYVPLTYGEASQDSIAGMNAIPQNELSLFGTIIAETAGASQSEAEKLRQELSYDIKSKIVEAYVADVKSGQQFGGALKTVSYNCRLRLNFGELLELKRLVPECSIEVVSITPRFGYQLPKNLQQYEALVEPYFDTALDLYTTLSNTPAAELLVMVGNTLDAYVVFDAKTALNLAEIRESKTINAIKKQLVELHPIIFTSVFK